MSDAIISLIPQLCLLPEQAAEVNAADHRCHSSRDHTTNGALLVRACPPRQLVFPLRGAAALRDDAFSLFLCLGRRDIVRSAARSREPPVSRAGSSRIRRGVYEIKQQQKRQEEFHGTPLLLLLHTNSDAAEETRGAQARSRYVCPNGDVREKRGGSAAIKTADVTFVFANAHFTVTAFPFPLRVCLRPDDAPRPSGSFCETL